MEGIVALVAIICGYKIISEIISARKETKLKQYGHCGRDERVIVHEEPGELSARALDLKRRLATLEEIIASERSHS